MKSQETNNIGIYKISIKEHIYIGQSKNITSRLKEHQRDLLSGKHNNTFLQNVYNKYKNTEDFELKTEILHNIPSEEDKENQTKTLSVLEQFYINYYNADLNIAPAFPNGIKKTKYKKEDNYESLREIYRKENKERGHNLFHPTKGKLKISNLTKFCIDNSLSKPDVIDVLHEIKIQSKGYFKSEALFKLYQREALDLDKGTQLALPTYEVEEINSCIEEIFGFNPDFNNRNLPVLSGDFTSTIFLKWLENMNSGTNNALTNISTAINQEGKSKLNTLKQSEVPDFIFNRPLSEGYIYGLGAGSARAFFPGNYSRFNEAVYGALVEYGRIEREDRSNDIFNEVFDIKLKSPFITEAMRLDYPIGIPTLVYPVQSHKKIESTQPVNPSKRNCLTLKEVLNRYKTGLVNNLFVIYVSGKLKFNQDLIASHYGLTKEKIEKKISEADFKIKTPENIQEREAVNEIIKNNLGGQVLLTSKQIELGIITSDVLNILKKVCSSNELSQFFNLEVELMVYYPKSKELSYVEWMNKYQDTEKLGIYKDNAQIDNRSKEWCRTSLNDFIGLLYKKRELFKHLSQKDNQYKTKQKLLKLIINAVYGDLASPYFPMGNTVVANNITASVRCYSWMMAKALRTKITVTDGGFYQYKDVNYIPNHYKTIRKPSLEKLFYQKESFFLKRKSLIDNFDINSTTKEEIDALAKKHIDDFWSIYKIDFKAEIEHKFENSSSLAVTNPFSKVDYCFKTYDGKIVWRMRGVKSNEIDIHPKAEAIRALMNNTTVNFQIAELVEMLGVNQYLKRIDKTVLPGHSIKITFHYFPNKNSRAVHKTFEDYEKSIKAYKKRIETYKETYKGMDLELVLPFEG